MSIAAYAAIVATGALALEIRRWFESGPQLSLRIMAHAQMVGLGVHDKQSLVVAIVTNRGTVPTTITHMGFIDHGSWFDVVRRRPSLQAIIPQPGVAGGPGLPFVLQPGTQWTGAGRYTQELVDRARKGRLRVQISSSHRATPLSRTVRLTERDLETMSVAAAD